MPRMHSSIKRSIFQYVTVAGWTIGLTVSLGCGSDATGPSDTSKNGYGALQLNHHAISLSLTAPSNQLQLQATPLTTRGDTIVTTNRVQYTSNDSSVVVDSTGLLTARLARTGVNVVARLTVTNEQGQQLTLADTAVVNVNAAPSPIPVFTKLQLVTPGDSATFSPVLGMTGIAVNALDASNALLTGVNKYTAYCRSSNATVVTYNRVATTDTLPVPSFAYLPGTTMITCSATIYGVSLTDSIPIRVGLPLYAKLLVKAQVRIAGDTTVVVSPSIARIGVGGIIQWDNQSMRTVDLVFDDSTVPQSVPASERTSGSGILGNVATCLAVKKCKLPTAAGNVRLSPATNVNFTDGVGRDFRKFTAAGTYTFHSATFPTVVGTIIVTQ